MESVDRLGRLRGLLGSIDRENTERFALLDRRIAQAAQESKDSTEKLANNAGEVLARLNERNQRARAAGGWVTTGTTDRDDVDEEDFGFEEEQPDREAGTAPLPVPPPPAQAGPPPPPPQARPRRAVAADEDDYSHTDWTAD